jgi:hypothetical protein
VEIAPEGANDGAENSVSCRVEEIVYKGATADLFCADDRGRRLHAVTTPARLADAGLGRGAGVTLILPARHLVALGPGATTREETIG